MKKIILIWALLISGAHFANAQKVDKRFSEGLKFYLSEDSVSYVKATVMGQFWARYNNNNPGSTVFDTPVDHSYDFGIRRMRFSALAQLTDRFFLHAQFGLNNINLVGARKQGLFIHDAVAQVNIYKKYIDVGFGLNGWNGTSRYSSSSITSILAMDLPVIQETTNDVTDQFGRKFGVYVKGKVGKFDYRFALAKPFPIQNAVSAVEGLKPGEVDKAYFSLVAPKANTAGYVYYAFLEEEGNQTPYMNGSYLGTKRVLNLGAGFQYQKDAMWYRTTAMDTVSAPLRQFGVDVFLDYYFNKDKGNAITAYVSYLNYFYGPNYLRNSAVMNPATGIVNPSHINGSGNGVPLIGTGDVFYGQLAYKFKNNLLGNMGTLQPYVVSSVANYEYLSDPVFIWNAGVNWLIKNQTVKLSLDYQNRPLFAPDSFGDLHSVQGGRRGQLVLQLQLAI